MAGVIAVINQKHKEAHEPLIGFANPALYQIGSGGSGDLFLFIKVRGHSVFERHGHDLQMDLSVSFAKAALGGEVKIKTLKEEVVMKIPEGTQSGQQLRLRGKGIPSKTPGDLILDIQVVLPSATTQKAREIYESMARELAFNPRNDNGS